MQYKPYKPTYAFNTEDGINNAYEQNADNEQKTTTPSAPTTLSEKPDEELLERMKLEQSLNAMTLGKPLQKMQNDLRKQGINPLTTSAVKEEVEKSTKVRQFFEEADMPMSEDGYIDLSAPNTNIANFDKRVQQYIDAGLAEAKRDAGGRIVGVTLKNSADISPYISSAIAEVSAPQEISARSQSDYFSELTKKVISQLPVNAKGEIEYKGVPYQWGELYESMYPVVAEKAHDGLINKNMDYYKWVFEQTMGIPYDEWYKGYADQRVGEIEQRVIALRDAVAEETGKIAEGRGREVAYSSGTLVPASLLGWASKEGGEMEASKQFNDVLEEIKSFRENSFAAGFDEGFDWLDALSMGLVDLGKSYSQMTLLEKAKRGEALSASEQNVLELLRLKQEFDGIKKNLGWEQSLASKVGSGLGTTVAIAAPFGASMSLTKPIMSTVKLASGIAKGATKRAVVAQVAKNVGQNVLASYARGAVAAPFMASTYTNYLKELQGQYSFKEDGTLAFEPKNKTLTFMGSYIDSMNEIASEYFGTTLGEVLGYGARTFGRVTRMNKVVDAIDNGIGKVIDKAISPIADDATRAATRKVARGLLVPSAELDADTKEMMQMLGWTDGYVSEAMSEAAGDIMSQVMRDAVGAEHDYSTFADRDFWLTNALVATMYGGVLNTLGNIVEGVNDYQQVIDLGKHIKKTLESVEGKELRNRLLTIMADGNIDRAVIELASIEWGKDGYHHTDKPKALDYVRSMYMMHTISGSIEEDSRVREFMKDVEKLSPMVYKGKQKNGDLVEVEANGRKYYVIDGKPADKSESSMLTCIDKETGEKKPILSREATNLTIRSFDKVVEDMYQQRFSAHIEASRLASIRSAYEQMVRPTYEEAKSLMSQYGITPPAEGDVITLVDGRTAKVTQDLEDGNYVVRLEGKVPLLFSVPFYSIRSANPLTARAQELMTEGKAVESVEKATDLASAEVESGAISEESVAQPTEQATTEEAQLPEAETTEQVEAEVANETLDMTNVPTDAEGNVAYDEINEPTQFAKVYAHEAGSKQQARTEVAEMRDAAIAKAEQVEAKSKNEITAIGKRKALREAKDLRKRAVFYNQVLEQLEETEAGFSTIVDNEYSRQIAEPTKRIVDAMAKKLGLKKVRFVERVNGGKANAKIKGDVVEIAFMERDSSIAFLMGHEFTHRMQALSPQAYAEFKQMVKDFVGEEAWTKEFERVKALYVVRGIAISDEALEDELTADMAGALVEQRDVFLDYLEGKKHDKTFVEKVRDILQELASFFNGVGDDEREKKILGMVDSLNNLIADAEAPKAQTAKAEGAESTEEKFSARLSADELAEIEAERKYIIETAKANGTYLKAPNGKDTNLTPEQWVEVRTKRFKKWFGDWELAAQKVDVVNITKHHIFDVSKKVQDVKRDAIDYAKSNGIIRTMSNDETGGKGEIIIAPKAIRKIVDDAYGSRPNIHIMLDAIAYLPKLIKESKLAEEHLSYEKGEDDVRRPENGINPKESIFRYYGAIAKEGKVYRAKITIKRDNGNQSQRAYTYEVMKIELTSGNTDSKKEDIPTLDNSISFAKLLQNVENDNKNGKKILDSSKIVDANGEPKVVWHGGQFGISSFIPRRNMHFGTKKAAMQRILDEQWGYDNWLVQNEDGSYSWKYEDEYDEAYKVQSKKTFATEEEAMEDALLYFGDEVVVKPYFLDIRNIERTDDAISSWDDTIEVVKEENISVDGIVYENWYEDKGSDSYIAFNPNQIKSATENIGTYDANNPDIRYSLRELDAPYLDAVERGDMETAQRMVLEAAKLAMPDTWVADENGNPRVMYHGDRKKARYIFSTDTFFTPNAEYARRYINGTGEVYATYLNIEKPFDIRDKRAYDIFTEFRGGRKPVETTSGAMDWAEYSYEDLQEYVEEVAPNRYDGFILDEGADPDGKGGVVHRGLSYVPFYPNQIKSADPVTYDDNGNVIPLSERFNPEKEDIRYSVRQPIFYSNAEYAVRGIKQEKATPEQWLKMIEKNGGLKAGEDKWLGLSDWLKASDKKTLTKDEVLQYIAWNNIPIEEVTYGVPEDISDSDIYGSDAFSGLVSDLTDYDEDDNPYINKERYKELQDQDPDFFDGFALDYWGDEIEVDDKMAAARYLGLLDVDNEINETRLRYTTDGLTNKKEIALVVPTIEPWNTSDNIHFGDAGEGRAVAWIRFGEAEAPRSEEVVRRVDEFDAPYKDVNGHDIYKAKDKLYKKDFISYGKLKSGEYAYVVYIDDKQIPVAHKSLEDARDAMNEYYKAHPAKRTRWDRVLVIDEIQSKRHQEGREKGYRSSYQKNEFDLFMDKMSAKYGDNWTKDNLTEEEEAELMSYANRSDVFKDKGIPDAPFEKNWAELAMKRMLRYAAENGFDKVAWTTGEQQADRYDMSNYFNSIKRFDIESMPGRRFELIGSSSIGVNVDEEGKIISSSMSELEGKLLADAVGKEMAVKMMQMENNTSLEDADLKIGGSGMKAFYDQMLPSFVRKYAKKWGATVGEVTMPDLEENNTMHSVDVTPAMRESVMQGQPKFSLRTMEELKGALDLYNKTSNIDNFVDTVKDISEGVGGNSYLQSLVGAYEEGYDKDWFAERINNIVGDFSGGYAPYTAGGERYSITYHGSGALFDHFDHAFMGTGEGAQAFGWGTYVTEVEGIGRTYADAISSKNNKHIKYNGNNLVDILRDGTRYDDVWRSWLQHIMSARSLDDLKNRINQVYIDGRIASPRNKRGRTVKEQKAELLKAIDDGLITFDKQRYLYTVDIPDDTKKNYLYWEKTNKLSNINRIIKQLREEGNDTGANAIQYIRHKVADGKVGYRIYEELVNIFGYNYRAASELLSRAGFVGISYPAQSTTGGRDDNARNYVIFNEDDVKIVGRERFSLRGSDKSLVGLHNISLDKLRKAIKMGGLANPSVAVIDVDKATHEDYGDYTLVLTSNMVDARLGRNAGTWAGDAWTPTYPQVVKRIAMSKDITRFHKDISKMPEAMRNRVRLQLNSFLEDRPADSFAYWYLFEKGVAPEMAVIPPVFPDDIVKMVSEATDGAFNMWQKSDEQKSRCVDAYIAYKYDGDRAAYEADLQSRKERLQRALNTTKSQLVAKKAAGDLAALEEFGFDYDAVSTFLREVETDNSRRGQSDVQGTIRLAENYIKDNNLEEDYQSWRDSLEGRYGVKEYIFDGYTDSGNQRWLPHTTANVSKWMKKQGREGATGTFPSFGLFVATVIPRMTTLNTIRKRKGHLGRPEQEYEAFKEKWEDVYYELGQKLQPDAERFEDYGWWRLIEAVSTNKPKEHIKKQYGIELSAEDMQKLNDMLDAIKSNYPARYFETKFERPVELSEFIAAVVPNDIPADVEASLQDAYLNIYKYDKGVEGSRQEAVLEATDSPSVRFSMRDESFNRAISYIKNIAREYNIKQPIFIAQSVDEYVAMMRDARVKDPESKREVEGTYIPRLDVICINGEKYSNTKELFGALMHERTHAITYTLKEKLNALLDTLNKDDVLAVRDIMLSEHYKKHSPYRVLNELISIFVGEIERQKLRTIFSGGYSIEKLMEDAEADFKGRGDVVGDVYRALIPIIKENLEIQKQLYNGERENHIVLGRGVLKESNNTQQEQAYSRGYNRRGNRPLERQTRVIGGDRTREGSTEDRGTEVEHYSARENFTAEEAYKASLLEEAMRMEREATSNGADIAQEIADRTGWVHLADGKWKFYGEGKLDITKQASAERAAFRWLESKKAIKVAQVHKVYDPLIRDAKKVVAEIESLPRADYAKLKKYVDKVEYILQGNPIESLPIEDQILADIALGTRLKWNDGDGKRGLKTELGLDSAKREKMGAVTSFAREYLEDYVARLMERNNGYEKGLDDNDIRNAVIEVFSSYPSPKAALEELYARYKPEADVTEAMDGLNRLEFERDKALAEVEAEYRDIFEDFDKNPNKYVREHQESEAYNANLDMYVGALGKVRKEVERLERNTKNRKLSDEEKASAMRAVKSTIAKELRDGLGRFTRKYDIQRMMDAVSDARTPYAMLRAIDKAMESLFEIKWRREFARMQSLTKAKLTYGVTTTDPSTFLNTFVSDHKITAADARKIMNDYWRGTKANGVSVAKYIDDTTRQAIEFISRFVEYADAVATFKGMPTTSIDDFARMLREKLENYTELDDRKMQAMLANDEVRKAIIDSVDILALYWKAQELQQTLNDDKHLRDINALELKVKDITAQISEVNKQIKALADNKVVVTKSGVKDKDTLRKELQEKYNALLAERMEAYAEMYSAMPDIIKLMTDANNAVEGLLRTGRVTLSIERAKRREHEKALIADALADLASPASPFKDTRDLNSNRTWKNIKTAIGNTVGAPLGSMDYMLRKMGRNAPMGEGRLYNRFAYAFQEAYDNIYIGIAQRKKMLDDKCNELWGKTYTDIQKNAEKTKVATISYTTARTNTNGEVVYIENSADIYVTQAMYILAMWDQADGRKALERQSFNEERIAFIREALDRIDPRWNEYAEWVINEYLPSGREKYNAVHRATFGTSMTFVPNYFPIKRAKEKIQKTEDVAKNDADLLPSTVVGAIKERTSNVVPIDIDTSFFEALNENTAVMEAWAEMVGIIEDINTLLSNGAVKITMEDISPSLFKDFKQAAQVATLSYIGKTPDIDKHLGTILNRLWAGSKIAFRLNTAFKQVSSALLFAGYEPDLKFQAMLLWRFVGGVGKAPTSMLNSIISGASLLTGTTFPKIDVMTNIEWARTHLPSFAKRWDEGVAGNELMARTTSGNTPWNQRKWYVKFDDAVRGVTKFGMKPNAFIDAFTSAAGARAVYDYAYDAFLKEDYSEEEAHRLAIIRAEMAFNTTQQSSEGLYLSPLQNDRSFLSTSLSTFMNAPYAMYRNSMIAIDEILRNAKKELKDIEKTEYDRYMSASRKAIDKQVAEEVERGVYTEGADAEQRKADLLEGAKEYITPRAQANAKKKRRKAKVKALVMLALNGYAGQLAFNIMGKLTDLLLGDDDEEKKRTIYDMATNSLWEAPLSMIPLGGQVITPLINGYEPSMFPSAGETIKDMDKIAKELRKEGFNDEAIHIGIKLALRSGFGINLDTIVNIILGINSMIEDGMSVEAFLKVINAPEKQIRNYVLQRREGETVKEYTERIMRFYSILETPIYEDYFNVKDGKRKDEETPFLMTQKDMDRIKWEDAYRRSVVLHYGDGKQLADIEATRKAYRKTKSDGYGDMHDSKKDILTTYTKKINLVEEQLKRTVVDSLYYKRLQQVTDLQNKYIDLYEQFKQ